MHPDPLTLDEESRAQLSSLDDDTRAQLGERWRRRAQAELEAGIFFAQLAPRVMSEVREPEVVKLFANAIGEEVRHAELCLALGELYLGRALDWPTPRTWDEPAIDGVDERTETALLVISMCCINEALASAYLRACHRAATVPLVRRVLAALLEDEIHHAQAGWAFLAPRARSLPLEKYLPHLVEFNRKMWLDRVRDELAHPAHGYVSPDEIAREIELCIDGVVLAGFRHIGR
jgi:hypothetical protein